MKRALLASVLLLGGCFDSIVSDHCADGYTFEDGHCTITTPGDGSGSDGTGGDGGGGGGGPVRESTCGADLTSDPDNCGTCGHICATGLCEDSKCVGEVTGHIVAIGHDYRHHHAAMARVLANAVALGRTHDVAVARWHGSSAAAAVTGTTSALAQGMVQLSRPWHSVTLPAEPSPVAFDGVDVLLVDAQTGDGDAAEAAGAMWAGPLSGFVERGGVVVVLEGVGGVSYRFAAGAGLYTFGAPVDETGHLANVTASTDAVAQQVPSPYLAEDASVALTGATDPIVTADDGQPLVVHLSR